MSPTDPTHLHSPDTHVIKNRPAYDQYIAMKDAPAINLPNRVILTSDSGIKIDPAAHMSAIVKKIKYLPADERSRVLKRVKAIKCLQNKVSQLRQLAYGVKKPRHHTSLSMGLLDERASELIEYFGQMKSTKEVHEIVLRTWHYDVSLETIVTFRRANLTAIEEKIKEFQSDYTDIRLTHKKGRLEELVDMYNTRKGKYKISTSLTDEKQLQLILKQIKDEVEGTSMRIDHHISGQIAITINYAVQQQVMKGMTINDIIIARVAARGGINPAFIISRLHKSFYAKNAGFLQPDTSIDEQEIQYPSQLVYNWNEIEKQHKDKGDTGLEYAAYEELSIIEQGLGESVKDQLMIKLGIKQAGVDAAIARIDNNANPI